MKSPSGLCSRWAVAGLLFLVCPVSVFGQDAATITPTPTASSQPTVPVSKTWPVATAPTFLADPRENRTSPSFPDPEYVKLLDYSLLFYEAQRSGKLPPDQRVTWRNDSALNDGKDVGMDLSGGYYDAGDYIKFIYPLTFSLSQTCWGGLEFFEGYQLANETQYLNQMVRWGMDWLIKAHPDNDTLFVQVGTGEVDNNYWGPDTTIPLPRKSFKVTRSSPGTDAIADAAAAFAACSMLYRDKLNDVNYANTLQSHAESLFQLAETAKPQQVYQKVVPAVSCCYASSGFVDELAWGAAWLFKLTRNPYYSQGVTNYVNQMNAQSTQLNPITWDDKSGCTYILMADATAGTSDNKRWQDLSEKFAEVTRTASNSCMFTKGGLYYCPGNSNDDSSVVAANAAFALNLLMSQMNRNNKGNSPSVQDKLNLYGEFVTSQVDYLLGSNPLKTPYVVGVHPNSPINPHSAPASGGVSADSIDTDPVKEAYTIYGALVGGPDKNDRFEDRRSDWRQNEVALDYNAPFNGLMAYQVMTSEVSPPYVVIPAGRPDLPPILNGMEVWLIILIVIGSIFVAIAIGAFVCYRKREQIRAWAAARKHRRNGSSSVRVAVGRGGANHAMKKVQSNVNGQNNSVRRDRQQDIIESLSVPSPDATGTQPRSSPPLPPPPPPPPVPTARNNRPVPPPPLPARHENPILLENAQRE